jgi:hypothetical protein
MIGWIFVAAIGGVLAVFWLLALFRRYRRGEITGRYLAAAVVGVVSVASFALLSALRPEFGSGPAVAIILLPAFIAILVVILEHRKATGSE